MFRRSIRQLIAIAALTVASAPALAGSVQTHTFDLSNIGVDSTFLNSSQNIGLSYNVGGPATLTGISFDVTYESFEPSGNAYLRIAVDTSDDFSENGDIYLENFGALYESGTVSLSGSLTFTAMNILNDGLVYVTPYKWIAIAGPSPHSLFAPGSTVTITYELNDTAPAAVPLPTSALAVTPLLSLVMLRRRR